MNAGSDHQILRGISQELGVQPHSFSPLSGGDINEVYLLEGNSEKFVVKLNGSARFPGMFEAEKLGLEKLMAPGVIDIPKPIKTGQIGSKAFLVLEYIQSSEKTSDFWELFGEQIAKLHKITSETFGFEKDNYIGSLPQLNEKQDTAASFYVEMRLEPQLKMAKDRGFKLNVPASFFKNCGNLIPNESPSLIHGDLWNGNYLVNSKGYPCLIDPAVAFAPREMDLAMMKLFGGFNPQLFSTYNEIFPLVMGWKERIPLWQLYYLLVHLNLFGAAYRSQVTSILRKFS
jgi:fructosamine-3-kinase